MQAPPLPSFFLETRQRVPSLAPSAVGLTLLQLPPFSQNPFSYVSPGMERESREDLKSARLQDGAIWALFESKIALQHRSGSSIIQTPRKSFLLSDTDFSSCND